MLPDPRVLLFDIEEACADIMHFTEGMNLNTYIGDSRTQAAVERKFAIIGEAINRLQKTHLELAQRIPQYRSIIDFRNLLIHGYASVLPDRVWSYTASQLPELRQVVQEILSELDARDL